MAINGYKLELWNNKCAGSSQAPHLLAALASYNSGDSAHLCYDHSELNATGARLRIEEDTTQDSETNHTTEVVSYLAIEGDGLLTAPVHEITRKRYRLGGQTVAVRVSGDPTAGNNGLFYVHSDHLGSAGVMSDGRGQAVPGSQARYYPFGD